MKYQIIFISFAVALCLVSCAHKSGHNRSETSRDYNHVEMSSQTREKANKVRRGGQRNLNVDISNNRGDKNKLDGSKIFAMYSTAVFMVFTSDGYNGYQGSGFFINSEGLAVSNYHVFQGTNIGVEQIKLANNDEVFKVTEVIHSDTDEDFILFRVNVSNTNYIPIAKYKPQVGEKVYAIGSPRGLENTFSSGEVSQ